jgi:phosphatidylglycerophosphate synthase
MDDANARADCCLVYVAETERTDVRPTDRIAGLSLAARVLRAAERAGFHMVIAWAPTCADFVRTSARKRARTLDVILCVNEREWADALGTVGAGGVTIVGPNVVVSPGLLEDARRIATLLGPPEGGPHASSGRAIHVPAGPGFPVSGVIVSPREILGDPSTLDLSIGGVEKMPDGVDVSAGRARLVAYLSARADIDAAERRVRRAIYKPTDPYLARFNRRLSIPLSVWLIRHTRLSANALSILLVAVGLLAAWLLSRGTYASSLAGAMLSLVASVLDGCDGEIARLTYTESRLGCWIETAGDYIYYLAVLAGLSIGAVRATGDPVFGWLGVGTLAGTVLTFTLLILLRRFATDGRPERLQQIVRQPFDHSGEGWARLMGRLGFVGTRSTMPYAIAAFAAIGALPFFTILTFIAAQAYWISLVVKWGQLMPQPAVAIAHRGRPSRLPRPDPRRKPFVGDAAVRRGTRS